MIRVECADCGVPLHVTEEQARALEAYGDEPVCFACFETEYLSDEDDE